MEIKKDSLYELAIDRLRKENFQDKAKVFLMKKCMQEILKKSEFYDSRSKKNRAFIVQLVEEFKEVLSTQKILTIIGISPVHFL